MDHTIFEDERTQAISDSIVSVFPDRRGSVLSSQQGSQTRFLFPPSLGYVDFMNSSFTYDCTMQGRGAPIPCRSAGMHSFWSTIRCLSGDGSAILDEQMNANTLAANRMLYNRSESTDNMRSEFEGVQLSDSYTGNIFHQPTTASGSAPHWAVDAAIPCPGANAGVPRENQPTTARTTQLMGQIQNSIFNAPGYFPVSLTRGLRVELVLEQFKRSLMYSTGSLGTSFHTGICPQFNASTAAEQIDTLSCAIATAAALGGDGTAAAGRQLALRITLAGTNRDAGGAASAYAVGDVCTLYNSSDPAGGAASIVGYCQVDAITGNAPAALSWLCTAPDLPPPEINATLFLGQTSRTAEDPDTPLTQSKVLVQCVLLGQGLVSNPNGSYFVEAGVNSVADSLVNATKPTAAASGFGTIGSMSDPPRVINGTQDPTKGGSVSTCFPSVQNPFSIGDQLSIQRQVATTAGDGHLYLGRIIGFSRAVSVRAVGCMRIHFVPQSADMIVTSTSAEFGAGAGTNKGVVGVFGVATVTIPAGYGINASQAGGYSFQGTAADSGGGYTYFISEQDRYAGAASPQFNLARTIQPIKSVMDGVIATPVGFTLDNLEYQTRIVDMDPGTVRKDASSASSGAGYTLSLSSVLSTLNTVTPHAGIQSEILNFPMVERAYGILTTSLVSADQFSLITDSLMGEADDLDSYQYATGGVLHPLQAVPVDKASLSFPLLNAQHLIELKKTLSQFDVTLGYLTNINAETFNIGRAFALPGSYADLSGEDLNLRLNYGSNTKKTKLLVSFLSYDRQVTISSDGIQTSG